MSFTLAYLLMGHISQNQDDSDSGLIHDMKQLHTITTFTSQQLAKNRKNSSGVLDWVRCGAQHGKTEISITTGGS